MAEKVDIAEFARKVEGLCDFLLSKIELVDGSPDINVILDLKETAADIHMSKVSQDRKETAAVDILRHTGGVSQSELTIAGLDAYLRNLPEA